MNIVSNIWNNWSTLEKVQEAVLLLSILLLSIVAIHYISKNKKLTVLSLIGFCISAILNLIGILIANYLFKIEITEVFRMLPLITSLLLLSNLGILIGFYIHRKNRKGFNIESIRFEYLTDTVKQTVFLLLLGSSIFLFLFAQTQAIVVVSILSCLGSVWSIYWISRYILK